MMKADPAYVAALVKAVAANRFDIVESLLAGGLDVNARVCDEQGASVGPTALHAAVSGGHVGMVRRLLAAGAQVNAVTEEGITPLLLAAAHSQCECAHLLLAVGADVQAANNAGYTALHAAARCGCVPLLCELVAAGADWLYELPEWEAIYDEETRKSYVVSGYFGGEH